MKEDDSTNITLKHLSLEITNERLGDKKALFDFFDRFGIQDFDNAAIMLY